MLFFVFKQKTAYELRISDWSSDVCSSDLTWGTVLPWTIVLKVYPLTREAPISKLTSVPGLAAPTRARVPRMARAEAAWRRTAGTPEIGRASSRERVCQYV